MKRVFKFKKGELWDGDEAIIHFLEDYLLEHITCNPGGCPSYRKNWKVTVIVEKDGNN